MTIFANYINVKRKMKISRLTALLMIAASAMVAVSCDKDEETEVKPRLEGSLTFYIPEFIKPGQTLTMTPKGIAHPEDKGIGFYWSVSPIMSDSDTTRLENGLSPDGKESDGSFTYTFPDSLGVYSVSCFAFAEDYTGSSASKYVTTVKPGLDGSLTETGIKASDPHITVDGINYYYTHIGELDWFRNNLENASCGAPYARAEIMSGVFGRFYNYEDALTACPEGWRLPTEEDWLALGEALGSKANTYGVVKGITAKLMADVKFNTATMWEFWPAVGNITNESKFSAVPAGYVNLGNKASDGTYPEADSNGVYEYAVFWTANAVEGDNEMAYYRYIVDNEPDLFISKGDKKNFGASVRCVR